MERNKIFLEKIKIKKIKKQSGNKLDMSKKKSNYLKLELPIKDQVPKEEILLDIGIENDQDGVIIYPRNIAIVSDGNGKVTDEGLKACEVNNIPFEDENKWHSENSPFELIRPECSSRLSNTSSCSSLSQSSFVFFESEGSVQEFKYGKLMEESNASLKGLHTESGKKMPFDNFMRNGSDFFDETVRERGSSQKSTLTVQQLDDNVTVRNSTEEEISVDKERRFDSGDAKLDGSDNSVQIQDNTLLLCGGKNQIKELKEALEKSTNCLLRCLENLQNTPQKHEKLNMERDYPTTKCDLSASKCKYSEGDMKTNLNNDEYNSDTSLSESYILKSNSTTDVKQRLSAKTCLTRVNNSKSKHVKSTKSRNCPCDCCDERCLHFHGTGINLNSDMLAVRKMRKKTTQSENCPCDCCNGKCLLHSTSQNLNDDLLEVAKNLTETTKPENCPCDCCNGRCFHFHSTRRNSNSDLLPAKNMSKIETVLTMSERDFSDNLRIFNATFKKYRLRSKNKQLLLPSELALVKKETASDMDEAELNTNDSRLVESNSTENQPFENYSEKSNFIKKEKNGDCRLKRKKKSKVIGIYRDNDQLEKSTVGEDESVSHDNEVDYDPTNILFLSFLFVMCILFCLIIFIFICI